MFGRQTAKSKATSSMSIDVIPPQNFTRQAPRGALIGDPRVVDAEFIDIDSVAETGVRFREVARAAAMSPEIELSAAPRRRGRGDAAFWTALVLLSAATFWISGGHALAKLTGYGPQIQVTDVNSHIVATRLGDVLFITGRVENGGDRAISLPQVHVNVGDTFALADLIAGTERLAAGGSVRFEARIPRADLVDVPPSFQLLKR
ncbi:conserved hypothetical protein [Rhizobium sp. EC-SD404]|nr:conserved hypothetical protein [Rhizobium sp. EC-SD404]